MGIDPVSLAILATAGVGAVSSIASGQQQKSQYKMQAEQAKLQAQADVTERTRALNEALANQNAMTGASGRTLESISSVIQGDKKKYETDVALIKSGAQAQAGQYKMAGSSAEGQGYVNALSSAATGAYQYSMLQK